MAHHAAHQYTLVSSHVMMKLADMVELDGTTVRASRDSKPRWLVTIDYATLALLLLAMSISAILLASTGYKAWRGGVIKLDTRTQTDEEGLTRKAALANTLLHNMDHTLHEDGEAVDGAKFWRSVRWHKTLIVVCAVAFAAFQTYRLAISPGTSGLDSFGLLQISIESAVSFYLILLLPIYACVKTDKSHSQITHHLFTISSFSLFHHYFASQGQALALGYSLQPHWTEAYSMGLAFAVAFACVTIRLGPGRHRELSRLYNKAVSEKSTQEGEAIEANVLGSGRSMLGRVMSFHINNLARYVSTQEQVDLHQLPVLPAAMQQQPSILRAVNWRKRPSTWLPPTLSLLSEVWGPQWSGWVKAYLALLVEVLASFVPHYCIQQILYTLDGHQDSRAVWAFTSLWTISRLAEVMGMTIRTWDYTQFGVDRPMRAHLSFLIYRKLLTRSTYSVSATVTGEDQSPHSNAEVMNLIQSDLHKVKDLLWTLTQFVRYTLQMGIGFFYIWSLLGPSGLWGISLSLLIYPPAYLLSRWQYRIFKAFVAVGDKRVSLLQEAIQTMSMIKMTASEAFWYRRLDVVRQNEFRLQLRARLVSTASGLLYSLAPVLVIAVSLGHYTVIRGEILTPSIAFTAISVFGEIRHTVTSFPQLFTDALQEAVSAQRISAFLRRPDVQYLVELESIATVAEVDKPLIVAGDIAWAVPQEDVASMNSAPFVLRDLDITFERGTVTLIAGKFGCGKSLLLNALLGEVALLRGRISYAVSAVVDPWQVENALDWDHCAEGLAFVPQTAWLQSLSIRDNVLFGLPMNVERYKRVLYACALLPDLEVLEDGDMTEIGERGKILSGGQKARVSLARAVYSRASTIILDDVISAVDAHTSQHIITKCFRSSLMSGRTIIIASHAVESLAALADRAIYLDKGRVQWQGSGPELLESEYMSHLKSETSAATSVTNDDPVASAEPDITVMPRKASLPSTIEEESFEVVRVPAKTPRQLLVDEDRAKGSVAFSLWSDILRMNGGPVYFTAFIGTTLISIVGPVAERQVIKLWSSGNNQATPLSWVVGYASLSAGLLFIQNIQYFLSFYGGFTAMKKMYQLTQDKVLRAKMQFFSKTRAGSILQRLGPDLAQVPQCSQLLGSIIESSSGFLISVISVAYYVGAAFPVAVAILIVLFYRQAMWYRRASRQVRRLVSILPGPVNALYGETVAGAAIIRAFGMQSVCVQNLVKTTNMHQSCYVLALSIGRWVTLYANLLDVLVVGATLALLTRTPGMTGGQAGFILGFASRVVYDLHDVLFYLRNYDLDGVKLERVAEYRNLEIEDIPCLYDNGDLIHSDDPILAALSHWPSQGALNVTNLAARYAPDMPDILHDVSFSCTGGERVGIVGATGGGKSTLAKALFSFVEVTKGKIEIDGKDTADVPLGILRSRMGIIAQDPVLLSGTLRLNLDLEGRYSDEELLHSRRQVQLIKANEGDSNPASETSSITAIGDDAEPGKAQDGQSQSRNINVFLNLEHKIETGGQNLSAGQKQLVVMARALLDRHKLLILDEATASIDSATDAEISRVVHEQFEGVTVLIIAHRLRTIMPCNKILVMDRGRIVQQGSPIALINEEGSKFQSLCQAAGEEEFRHLVSLAEQAKAA